MRIELNPIQCEAHGLCAELLPEHVALDEWGYPVIDDAPLPRALLDLARRAAKVCPTLALTLRADTSADLPRRARSVRPGRELRDQRDRQHEPRQ